MASIYNITTELEDIFLELEENGGELTPELEERLAITQDNLKSNLMVIVKHILYLILKLNLVKKKSND
jgi:hypothetical protein